MACGYDISCCFAHVDDKRTYPNGMPSLDDSVFCVGNGGGVEGIDACWGTIVSLANGLSRMECQQYDDAPDCQ